MSDKDTILFIASDSSFREALQGFAASEGHPAFVARNGAEGLRLAATGSTAIMVVQGDGRELADQLPNLVALCPHALVVMVEDPPAIDEEPREMPSPWTIRLVRGPGPSSDRAILLPTISRLVARELERRALIRENRDLRAAREASPPVVASAPEPEEPRETPPEPEAVERLKTDFLSLISREFRTPLATIIGFSEIISHRLHESQEDLDAMVKVILRSGIELEAFLNDSLEYLQWTSGNMSLTRGEFDLVPHLQRVIRECSEAYREKRVRVLFRGLNALRMMGDARLIASAIGRVLDNAFKYSAAGGVVEISLGEESRPPAEGGATMVLKIRDHGVGLHRHQIEGLFHPLEFRGDSFNHTGGHGLGLAIASECLRSHGGHITLESEGPNKGCLACLELTVGKFSAPYEGHKIALRDIQNIA